MQLQQMPQKTWSEHTEYGIEVFAQHVGNGKLVMTVRFLEEGEVALEASFPFILLDLGFHGGEIRREAKMHTIVKVNVVVWFTFNQLDAFVFHTSPYILERLVEEMG